jgi:hypothetical protein
MDEFIGKKSARFLRRTQASVDCVDEEYDPIDDAPEDADCLCLFRLKF